ncbi:hypothetical protein SAMN02745866_03535 [Alteromonadaceae bacterium Bs31]|nr:hypothetical protein SAMN02745866_03535 [Alteromonadaceae bacterium Bs31]
MVKLKLLILILTTAFVLFSQFANAETAVIVHPSNGVSLDKDSIGKIFLGKAKSFPGGESVLPVNQKEGSDIRTGFDETVLGKSSSQIKAYWSKLMFTGKGQPPKEVSSAEVKSLVAGNPATIGYIDASEVDASVKVVFTF